MTFVPIAVELLTENAVAADSLFVKYKKISTGQVRSGGVYTRADSQKRYLRLRSHWRADPQDERKKVEFSVQINDDIQFLVEQHNARLLQARANIINLYGSSAPSTEALSPSKDVGFDSNPDDIVECHGIVADTTTSPQQFDHEEDTIVLGSHICTTPTPITDTVNENHATVPISPMSLNSAGDHVFYDDENKLHNTPIIKRMSVFNLCLLYIISTTDKLINN